jgi:hypothetical protein
MDIQNFLRNAITQIVAGVAEARNSIEEYGSRAGSDKVYGFTKDNKILTDGQGRVVTLGEFDLALSEASSTETKGGLGVFLGSFGVGSQGASQGEASSLSRIKFSVPVVLPGGISGDV